MRFRKRNQIILPSLGPHEVLRARAPLRDVAEEDSRMLARNQIHASLREQKTQRDGQESQELA